MSSLNRTNTLRYLGIAVVAISLGTGLWALVRPTITHQGETVADSAETDLRSHESSKQFRGLPRVDEIVSGSVTPLGRDNLNQPEESFSDRRQAWRLLQDDLRAMPVEDLLTAMLDGVKTDKRLMNYANREFVARVKAGHIEGLRLLSERFAGLDEAAQAYVAVALGRMGTPEALDLIIYLLSTDETRPLARIRLLQAIANFAGANETDALAILARLKDVAETQIIDVPEIRNAALLGIAKIDLDPGVNYLIQDFMIRGAQDQALSAAIMEMRSVKAVNALGPILLPDKALVDERALIAGNALAQMGMPEATEVILRWAQSADASVSSQAAAWLGLPGDTQSSALIVSALADGRFVGTPIQDELVRLVRQFENEQPQRTGGGF